MSELGKIIEGYRDRHGQPAYASIARSIGVAPQTLDSWRHRGMKQTPRDLEPFHRLARLVGLDYSIVAAAVAFDVGLAPTMPAWSWPDERRVTG